MGMHYFSHIKVQCMHKILRAQPELHGFGHHFLITKKHLQKGDHHGKGEEGEEGPQYIVYNILCHIPFVGNQVIQKPEKSFYIYSPV